MKPMLAYTVKDLDSLSYPLLAQIKLDGIRAIVADGVPYTRTLKSIPNNYIFSCLYGLPLLDGELVVGPPNSPDVFTKSTSGVMSREGQPDFTYFVFDAPDTNRPYWERYQILASYDLPEFVKIVPAEVVGSARELSVVEDRYIQAGFEGVMVRNPKGVYKYGRSTQKEGLLGKLKRFKDEEAVIVGVEELYHNENEKETNELGYTERSSAQAGLVPAGTLGALVVRKPDGETFKIGTGYTQAQRDVLWVQREYLKGKTVKYKHQLSGAKDKPRFPVYLGLRED